jgi:ABC-type nitrate/sulfonate/bicarbonate transport system ATPase subunit
MLHIDGISFKRAGLPVIHWLDAEIVEGEFVAIVGPSGCDKTTLLDLLSGHLTPTDGTLRRKGTVRTIYQQDGLFPWLTVRENLGLGLRKLSARKRDPQLDEWLELIGLKDFESHYPHQLSGGMRQRVELARILAGNAGSSWWRSSSRSGLWSCATSSGASRNLACGPRRTGSRRRRSHRPTSASRRSS